MSCLENDRFLEERYEQYLEEGMTEKEAAMWALFDLEDSDNCDDSWREYDIDDNFEEEV